MSSSLCPSLVERIYLFFFQGDLLDELYLHVETEAPPKMFGIRWALRELKTGGWCKNWGVMGDEHAETRDSGSRGRSAKGLSVPSESPTMRSEQSLNTAPLHASVPDWDSNNSGTNSP